MPNKRATVQLHGGCFNTPLHAGLLHSLQRSLASDKLVAARHGVHPGAIGAVHGRVSRGGECGCFGDEGYGLVLPRVGELGLLADRRIPVSVDTPIAISLSLSLSPTPTPPTLLRCHYHHTHRWLRMFVHMRTQTHPHAPTPTPPARIHKRARRDTSTS